VLYPMLVETYNSPSWEKSHGVTLILRVYFNELWIHPINDRRVELVYERFGLSHDVKWFRREKLGSTSFECVLILV
jgi:hypothetical protein